MEVSRDICGFGKDDDWPVTNKSETDNFFILVKGLVVSVIGHFTCLIWIKSVILRGNGQFF
jgi:hypothetical protein